MTEINVNLTTNGENTLPTLTVSIDGHIQKYTVSNSNVPEREAETLNNASAFNALLRTSYLHGHSTPNLFFAAGTGNFTVYRDDAVVTLNKKNLNIAPPGEGVPVTAEYVARYLANLQAQVNEAFCEKYPVIEENFGLVTGPDAEEPTQGDYMGIDTAEDTSGGQWVITILLPKGATVTH